MCEAAAIISWMSYYPFDADMCLGTVQFTTIEFTCDGNTDLTLTIYI